MINDLQAVLDACPELQAEIAASIERGLQALAVPAPMRASEWANRHFYLSAESSYVEQRWETWPFQRAILDCMGHDDIESVAFKKSARVGYTKMLLACVGYFAEHKRRNQVVYQPTDDDADDWVKTELDTMLRDVGAMQRVLPSFLRRSKDNTLQQKSFLGSKLHIRGGKAAKNYRRLTTDVVYLDELDGFDRDIEKEGSPTKLSKKRLEGALFPKHIKGSTPKLTGFSLIDEEYDAAELQFCFQVPCSHCGREHALEWGGKTARHGFKWVSGDAATVVHICQHCGVGETQADYLAHWHLGRWISDNGTWIDAECNFRAPDGRLVATPRTVAFRIWTAYSPQATWASIVAEFLEAHALLCAGDHTAMKTWTNTTKGESFKLEGAKTNADVLVQRAKAETYRLRLVPRGGMVLAAGVDVQDNRFEVVVWAAGRDDERWAIDYRVMPCDPGQWDSWLKLDAYLGTRFPHEGGQTLAIDIVGVDTGGHFTHAVYRYAMLREARRVYATRGSTLDYQPIVAGTPKKQDVNLDGQVVRDGVKLWQIGTGTVKDLIHSRLRVAQPGPGYMHMTHELPAEFFTQLTAEERVEQKTARGIVWRWMKPKSNTRNEVLDCTVICEFGFARMKLHQYTDAEWRRLEEALCPQTADLFSMPAIEPLPLPPGPLQVDNGGPLVVLPPAVDIPPDIPTAALWALPRGRRVRGAAA